MAADRSELQRPPRTLLPTHVREVEHSRPRTVPVRRDHVDRGRNPVAAEVRDGLGKVVERNRLDPRQRGLGRAVGGAEEARQTGPPRSFRRGQNTPDRPQAPVERQLPYRRVTEQLVGGELPRGTEDCERDRQVETGPLLPQLGRGEVDSDTPTLRELELRGGDAASHPFLRLLASAVGKPDDRERGDPVLKVRLDLDAAGVQPDEGGRDGACEHVATVDNKTSRVGKGMCRNSAKTPANRR